MPPRASLAFLCTALAGCLKDPEPSSLDEDCAQNLLDNGGFEDPDGLSSWNLANATHSITSEPHTGSHALEICATEELDVRLEQAVDFDGSTPSAVRATIYTKSEPGRMQNFRLLLGTDGEQQLTIGSEWRQMSATQEFDGDEAFVILSLRPTVFDPGGSCILVDSACIEPFEP